MRRVLLSALLLGASSSTFAAELQVLEKGGKTLVVATVKDGVQLYSVSWWCAKDVDGRITLVALADAPAGCPAGSSPNPYLSEAMTPELLAKLPKDVPTQRPPSRP